MLSRFSFAGSAKKAAAETMSSGTETEIKTNVTLDVKGNIGKLIQKENFQRDLPDSSFHFIARLHTKVLNFIFANVHSRRKMPKSAAVIAASD